MPPSAPAFPPVWSRPHRLPAVVVLVQRGHGACRQNALAGVVLPAREEDRPAPPAGAGAPGFRGVRVPARPRWARVEVAPIRKLAARDLAAREQEPPPPVLVWAAAGGCRQRAPQRLRVPEGSPLQPVPAVVRAPGPLAPAPAAASPAAAAPPPAPARAPGPGPTPHRSMAAKRSVATASGGPPPQGPRRERATGPIETHSGPRRQGPSESGGIVTSATRCWPDAEMSPITSMIRP